MPNTLSFNDFNLLPEVVSALTDQGYETPTPVQELSIPILLNGEDLLAQAQTGTGKTAAFALPILSQVDLSIKKPQALIIAPTRELAIQVSDAFQRYAKYLKGFQTTPIYGGQDYSTQLKALKQGAHVIVGTPGRVMDHLRRGTLVLDVLKILVLDEADEMLRMGFIDDVEWILTQIPGEHQTALFSATLPEFIKKIAKNYLKDPQKVNIKAKENAVISIEQCYVRIAASQKFAALHRFLESEDLEAAIVFARTKTSASDIAEQLQARGYSAAALHGDMAQTMRKQVIDRMKKGNLNIIVATDVAARGIDIPRLSHVFNFDIPGDTESYVHRIGRTGRAGRQGKAILFVTPKEQHLVKTIERFFNAPIKEVELPSVKEIQAKRNIALAEKILAVLDKTSSLDYYHAIIDDLAEKHQLNPKDIAAALVCLSQKANPIPSIDNNAKSAADSSDRGGYKKRGDSKPRSSYARERSSGSDARKPRSGSRDRDDRPRSAPRDRDDSRSRSAQRDRDDKPRSSFRDRDAQPRSTFRDRDDKSRSAPSRDRDARPRSAPRDRDAQPRAETKDGGKITYRKKSDTSTRSYTKKKK